MVSSNGEKIPFDQVMSRDISRRHLLKSAGMLGISVPVLASLLAACGDDDDDQDDDASDVSDEGDADEDPDVEDESAEDEDPDEADESADDEDADGAGAEQGGTLTIGRPIDSTALDPHQDITGPSAYVYSNIFETLVKLTTGMELEPGLAESWEQVEDDRWRFFLREGVLFHDGSELTADAVQFSIERYKDPDDPGLTQSHLAAITAVEVEDDYTVDIVTDGPLGPVLRILSWGASGGIASPAAVEERGEDFAQDPSGTGPFRLQEWVRDTSITLQRFEDYWGEPANVDEVVFRVMPEESSRMLALRSGEVDLIQVPSPAELEDLAADDEFEVHEAPADRVLYFGFHTEHPPVDDPAVRRAIAHAFNPQPILDNILEGAATPATSIISPVVFGHTDITEYFEYDPDEAERLLTDVGWERNDSGEWEKDGEPLFIRHQSPRGRYLKDQETSEAFQAQMQQFGISVELESPEWATMFSGLRQEGGADAEIFTLGWSTAIADADFGLRLMFHSDNIVPAGLNYTMHSDPEYDELVERAESSTDPDEREELYAEAQHILGEAMVAMPVFTMKALAVSTSRVKGFEIHPNDFNLWLDKAWIED